MLPAVLLLSQAVAPAADPHNFSGVWQLAPGGGGQGPRRILAAFAHFLRNARVLAELDVAMADAAIGCWDAKYTFNFWRPITAIRETGDDGNAATAPDTTWTPLFATPAHPDYPSGHSCVSGAATTILAKEFGSAPVSI